MNVAVTFQQMLHKVLVGYRRRNCLFYWDDIFIFLKDISIRVNDLKNISNYS